MSDTKECHKCKVTKNDNCFYQTNKICKQCYNRENLHDLQNIVVGNENTKYDFIKPMNQLLEAIDNLNILLEESLLERSQTN